MFAPRIGSMLAYQLTFIARDNIASFLGQGAPSALTYGWMIQQVPETLIGTAFGTALLPTISEYFARKEFTRFRSTIENSKRILIALSIPIAFLMSLILKLFIELAFGFNPIETQQLLWVSRAFLIGLVSHSLLEVGARVFFAQKNALFPFIGAILNLSVYVIFGNLLAGMFGAPGLALADSIAFSVQTIFLFLVFNIRFSKAHDEESKSLLKAIVGTREERKTFARTIMGTLIASLIVWGFLRLPLPISGVIKAFIAFIIGIVAVLPFIIKEVKVFLRL